MVMTAQEYLGQVKKLDALIGSKLSEIRNLKDVATSTTAALRLDNAHGKGMTSDKVGNSVVAIMELEEEMNGEIERLVLLRNEILKTISSLEPAEYDLIYKRYFQYKTWEEISDEMYYSRQWIHMLHKKTLKKIDKILKEFT